MKNQTNQMAVALVDVAKKPVVRWQWTAPPMPPRNLHMRVDLLEAQEGSMRRKRHHNPWWWLRLAIFFVVLLVGTSALVSFRVLSAVKTPGANGAQVSLFDQVKHLITNRDRPLDGEATDRINIILAGIGGQGHEGPYLTDTLMVVSLKPSTQQVAMLSIPRDLAVNLGPLYGYRKINSALALGRESDSANPDKLLISTVSDVIAQPINYVVRLDFAGFEEAIDKLGGIDVTVDQAFSDSTYPTEDYGVKTVHFATGKQHMDGATALIFARSRHGNNGEGSDFARARRQQKIILAVRDKVFSVSSIVNPKRITDLIESVGNHTSTNLELWQVLRLANLAGGMNHSNVITKVLDTEPNGLLKVATGIDGAFLLVPKVGDEREIRALAANIFLVDAVPGEHARVAVENATGRASGDRVIVQALERGGITVVSQTQLAKQAQTVIYEFVGGQKPASLSFLRELVRAEVTSPTPLVLTSPNSPSLSYNNINATLEQPGNADFLIILGSDSLTTSVATSRL